MTSFRTAVCLILVAVPSLLRADATIRYKTDTTSSMPLPGLGGSGSVIYMKGSKGVAVSGGQTTIADFTKNEVTIIDTDRNKYATLPVADYGTRMAESMPKTGAVSQMFNSMQVKCESSNTAGAEVILGVQAQGREQTCSLSMKLPVSAQPAPAAMPGISMKIVTHIWSAAAGERARVPALWQLSGYELWQKYFMNPGPAMAKMMPGMESMMDELQKDQSPILRLTMELSMNTPSVPGQTGAPGVPMMKFTEEVVELSTTPLDDSLFQIPANCAASDLGDLMNGIMQTRLQALKTPAAQPPGAASAVPASIKAYVPTLLPLSRIEPVNPAGDTQGIVEILVTVGPKGTVEDTEPLSGPEPLRQAARDAVKKWTFRPVIRVGAPVTAYTTASVFLFDPNKPRGGAFQFSPDVTAASKRETELEQALPRSPQQVLADLEQDAGGGDKGRRYDLLPKLTKAALAADANDRAAAYANELLAAAQQSKNAARHGDEIHDGHAALGLVALRNNDIAAARGQLLEAGKTSGSPVLESFGPDMTLASELLKRGERDVVLEYFTLCRNFWKSGGPQLDAWTQTVRKGETPFFGANLR